MEEEKSYFENLWENYNETDMSEWLLNEGLIHTHPVAPTVGILKRKYPQWSFKYIKQSTSFTITINKTKYPNIPEISELINELNNLGWFVANIEYDGKINYKGKSDSNILNIAFESPFVDNIILYCEAKYDVLVDKYPSKLYHITNKDSWNKIQTKGLSPKSGNKLSNHPERVYLANSVENAEFLARKMYSLDKINKSKGQYIPSNIYVILEINTEMLDNWFRLYQDPNYIGKGYYTLNTINPWSIKSVKEIEL